MVPYALLFAFCVILDQLSKWAVVGFLNKPVELTPFLNLTRVFNEGFLFGLGRNWSGALKEFFYLGVPTLFVVAVAVAAFRVKNRWLKVALTLIAAGGTGNLIDRFLRGEVVDFIDFHLGYWHYPAFNIADICVSSGILLAFLALFIPPKGGFSSH